MTDDNKPGRKPRGFAAMSPETLRGIAAQGGRAAHAMGKAHRFDSKEAREAATKRHAAKTTNPAGHQAAGDGGNDAEQPATVAGSGDAKH